MSVFYVILGIALVLGLIAIQMLVWNRKGMEFMTASLQARALHPRVFVRTSLAFLVSLIYAFIGSYMDRKYHVPDQLALYCILYSVPAVIFFFFVPVPPAWLIAAFGITTARVIWSVLCCGLSYPLIYLIYVLLLIFSGGPIYL
jgi:hypothetical protein